jgi:hypothetical protein
MKNLTVIFAILLLVGCSPKQCEKDDPKVVEQTILDYFKAISDGEFDKLNSISTIDLVLYEDGLIWNNDSLVQAVKGYLDYFPGAEMSYQLENFDTKVDCNSARTKYINIGKLESPDTTINIKWTESATFIKENGIWKLEFIHSTPMK